MSKIKLNLNEESMSELESCVNTLKERGLKKPDMSPFINSLLKSDFAKEKLNEYVNLQTPLEWKLKMLGSDPSFEEQISSLVSQQDFGANYQIKNQEM